MKRTKIILKTILISIIVISALQGFSQKYLTKNGYIRFYSETPLETIQAENKQVNAALDLQTGDFVFKILIQSFEFPKALMQEHFNENYMESDKFPNAMFKGKIVNLKDIDFNKEGTYKVNVDGDLTIHGVTKTISEPGTIIIKGDGKVQGKSKFNIKVADYDIRIPKAVTENIADSIEVTVDVEMSKM